jgi:putative FmdB family regulatory protein
VKALLAFRDYLWFTRRYQGGVVGWPVRNPLRDRFLLWGFLEEFKVPIYEYLCGDCTKAFSFLAGVVADSGKPSCPRCGGKKLSKLVSRIARVRSKDSVLEDLADPGKIGNLEDPKVMAQWMKKVGGTLGEEGGKDMEAEIDGMLEEAGQKGDYRDDE